MGVTLFRLDAGERVTSVFPVLDDGEGDGNGEPAAENPAPEPDDDGTAGDG